MSDAERNQNGKSIRELAGDETRHRMENPEQKKTVDALLNMTPEALAKHIIAAHQKKEVELIRLMVERGILNPTQCELLTVEFADLYKRMKVIDAQKINMNRLIASIVAKASDTTREHIQEALKMRLNDDGRLDFLV